MLKWKSSEMAKTKEPTAWRICIEGKVDRSWADWFDSMTLSYERRADGVWLTWVSGQLRDQTALRGVVTRMWDLNLRVLSVSPLDEIGRGKKE